MGGGSTYAGLASCPDIAGLCEPQAGAVLEAGAEPVLGLSLPHGDDPPDWGMVRLPSSMGQTVWRAEVAGDMMATCRMDADGEKMESRRQKGDCS